MTREQEKVVLDKYMNVNANKPTSDQSSNEINGGKTHTVGG